MAGSASIAIEVGRLRRRLGRRSGLAVAGLAAALLAVLALGLTSGDYPVTASEVAAALLSPLSGAALPGIDFIVLEVRLPRAALALLAGAAFGLSGAIFQALLRNPLASPDIVGIAQGASTAAVFCIVVLGWSGLALAGGALGGAVLTAAAIHVLAWREGLSPYRVVLVGIALAAMLSAATSYLLTRARIQDVQEALGWLVGSLNATSGGEIATLLAAMALLVPTALILARGLAPLQLGDDAARAVGARVTVTRSGLLGCAVALSAFATAAVGPVAFVAFVSGPIARRLAGTGRLELLPSMLVGALVLTGADVVAQHALPGADLPAGVVTGLFGGAFLLLLLGRVGRAGQVD